jgi:hypothetical protein
MRRVFLLGLASCLGLALVTGCYYFDEQYKYDEEYPSGGAIWDDPDGREAVVKFPDTPRDERTPVEAVEDPVGPRDDAPAEPRSDGTGSAASLVPSETIGKFDVHLRISGVQAEMKGALEAKLRALPSVEYVETIFYGSGDMKLGIALKGSLEAFVDDLRGMKTPPVVFLGTTTLILGRLRPASGLEVKIFGPKDGAVLSTARVWVGVEVSGGTAASVSINGVDAVPMEGKGRFKALVSCRPGQNEIVAVARGRSGGVAEDRIRLNVKVEGPSKDAGRTVLVKGKIDDPGGTVTVNGSRVKVDGNGNYQVKVKVLEGERFVTVVETDSLGNRTIRKIAVE